MYLYYVFFKYEYYLFVLASYVLSNSSTLTYWLLCLVVVMVLVKYNWE